MTRVDLEQVIFIVGVGRSGTTLLQCMLDSHSRISFLPETHFMRHYPGNPKELAQLRRQGVGKVLERLYADRDIQRARGVSPPDSSDGRPESLKAFYCSLLTEYASVRGTERVGDKDPKNVEFLPVIHSWFPRARVIHMVRDPRDVVVSRMQAQWSRKRPFLSQLAACRGQLHLGCSEGPALFGRNYREVLYEELIASPEKTLSELCIWLGVEFEPNMLTFQKSAAELIHHREKAWKKECSGPLLSKNAGNFKNKLSRNRILQTEWVCGEAFARFGYPLSPDSGSLSPWERLQKKGLDLLFRGFDFLYSLRHVRKLHKVLTENANQY